MCFYAQQVEGQPSKKPRKNVDNSAVALLENSRLLGYVFPDTEPPGKVRCSMNAPRHSKIREKKGPSLGVIQSTILHERSPYAPKFEARSQEEQKCKSDVPAEMRG